MWTTDTCLFIYYTQNVLLFKFRYNIFIGVRIIKEMSGSVASGTRCITLQDKLCSLELPTDLDTWNDHGNDDLTTKKKKNKEKLGRKDIR